ncbi:MAG: cytochrome c [Candidatus Sulfotelmatobacter sp.]
MTNCLSRNKTAVLLLAGLAGTCLFLASIGHAERTTKAQSANAGNDTAEIARGQYIVQDVAMCGQCHTPRNSDGTLDETHALEGAPVFFRPSGSFSDWPLKAPRIGGTPPASDADMVKLLTTGIWITGKPLRFPMMPFRMNNTDAKAVVAYLRTVHPEQ